MVGAEIDCCIEQVVAIRSAEIEAQRRENLFERPLLLLLRILVFRPLRLAVAIGFHTPRSIATRNASHRHKIEFSFLKRNLAG
jgi:hypothetical protein